MFALCHILPSLESGLNYVLLRKIVIIKHKKGGKEDPCPCACGKRTGWWERERERWAHKKGRFFFFFLLWKMKGVVEKARRSEEQTVSIFCWCDEGLCTGPERSVHCGDTQTTQTLLHKFFLKPGEETLRFTVATSRLYNVDVKLHAEGQWKTAPWCFEEPSTPSSHPWTPTLFVFQRNHADSTAKAIFFCLYWEKSRNWYCEAFETTLAVAIELSEEKPRHWMSRTIKYDAHHSRGWNPYLPHCTIR